MKENKVLYDKNGNPIQKRRSRLTYVLFAIFFVGLSILSIYLVYRYTDSSSFDVFSLFTPEIYLQLLLLTLVYYLVDTLRFHYMLKALGVHIEFPYMLWMNVVNIFVSAITPFSTGGGIGQIYFLNRRGVSLADVTAAVLIRTILSISVYFIMIPFLILFNHELLKVLPTGGNLVIILSTITIYFVAILFFYLVLRKTRMIKGIIYRFTTSLKRRHIISKATHRRLNRSGFLTVDDFSKNMRNFLRGKKIYVLNAFLFTFFYIILLSSFSVILIQAASPGKRAFPILSLQIMVTFVTYFAPTPGATGAAEGGFYLVFNNYVPEQMIASLIFLWRFFSIYIGVALGMAFSAYEFRRLKRNHLPSIIV